MKRYFLVAWTALILGSAAFNAESSDINVQIVPHSVVNQTSSSVVTVTVHNISASAVYIPKSLSPLYTPGDHLMTRLFNIADSSGKDVTFTGRMVRVAPREPDTFFFKIEAGQSMSQDLDLSADYDLSKGGTFQVSYSQGYTKAVHTDDQGEIDSDFAYQDSDVAAVWISPPAVNTKLHRVTSLHPLRRRTENNAQALSMPPLTRRYWLRTTFLMTPSKALNRYLL